jgi:transportin-3
LHVISQVIKQLNFESTNLETFSEFLCFQNEGDVQGIEAANNDPLHWLDRLASVFCNLNLSVSNEEPHPCQPVVTDVWPVLSSTFDRFQTDRKIIGGCCRCLGFAIRMIGRQSAPLLESLVTQIVALHAADNTAASIFRRRK